MPSGAVCRCLEVCHVANDDPTGPCPGWAASLDRVTTFGPYAMRGARPPRSPFLRTFTLLRTALRLRLLFAQNLPGRQEQCANHRARHEPGDADQRQAAERRQQHQIVGPWPRLTGTQAGRGKRAGDAVFGRNSGP